MLLRDVYHGVTEITETSQNRRRKFSPLAFRVANMPQRAVWLKRLRKAQ